MQAVEGEAEHRRHRPADEEVNEKTALLSRHTHPPRAAYDGEDDEPSVLFMDVSEEQRRAYRYRGVYLAVALVQSAWISGTVYGWPAFLLMLRAEHIYSDRCGTDPLVDHHGQGLPPSANATTPGDKIEVFYLRYP